MTCGRSRKQQKIDAQQHYEEMETTHNEKASREFRRKPYQNCAVEDFARKLGADTKKVIERE